jgi:hypothetical protein
MGDVVHIYMMFGLAYDTSVWFCIKVAINVNRSVFICLLNATTLILLLESECLLTSLSFFLISKLMFPQEIGLYN